jgi:hypothetical protein
VCSSDLERALERLEVDLQGVGRNEQVLRERLERCAVEARNDPKLKLLWRTGVSGGWLLAQGFCE